MKKCIALILILCMVLSLAACAKTETSPETTATVEAAEPTPQETAAPEVETVPVRYPIEVTDHAGRQVLIPREPQRIVSSYYISTSALIALGLSGKMVGVEVNPQRRTVYKHSAPQLLDLPNVGTAKELDLEGCLVLQPDLVILPLRLKDAAESLAQFDIPVLLINPESRELQMAMMEMIGQATNTQEKASALKAFIEAQEARLSGISGDAPSVYLAGNTAFLTTAGGAMYQSDMITLAGGNNVAQELPDDYWAEISYEQLLAWDPEYIVLASDASYSVEDVLDDPNLADCRAVRSGNVVHLPNDMEPWDSPVPGSILGALWLASVLHETQNPWEYTTEVITSFYEEFYGFTYPAA